MHTIKVLIELTTEEADGALFELMHWRSTAGAAVLQEGTGKIRRALGEAVKRSISAGQEVPPAP